MYLIKVEIDSHSFPTRRFYPFNIPVFRETSELILKKPIVFFVGENGTGKSTLLEAISKRCGIYIWDKPRRHLAHNNPYETRLADYITVTWANGRVPGSLFRAETFRDFADFLDDVALCDPGRLRYHGGHILNTLSRGEAILSYFSGRYQIRGLYLLDEPVALKPSEVPEATTPAGEGRPRSIHYGHPLADSAGLPRCSDLQFRSPSYQRGEL